MKTVLIVGGGPGGLTTLKTLLHFPGQEREFDPLILEAAPSIGGTFSQRSYENGALVSSKQLTSFSDCESIPRTRRSAMRRVLILMAIARRRPLPARLA